MCSLVLLALKQLKACKNCNAYLFVILYFQTISFKLRKLFNNRNSGADVSGHDIKSYKAKRISFKTRGTLPNLGFVFADKPLIMAFYHSYGVKLTKSKKPHTIAAEVMKPWVLK